jgi:acetylornithine aminotransferase/acetylornithine/N-succinyldiaminopimelate aminotransferase
MHGTTFGGGPLVCAVAIAVIDTMKQANLLAHVRDVGGYFKDRLEWLRKQHDCITTVRGMGLMLGIELVSEELAKRAASAMLDQHIIVNRTSETVLRFLPPFILERTHVDRAITALDGILTTLTLNSAILAGRAPAGEDFHG